MKTSMRAAITRRHVLRAAGAVSLAAPLAALQAAHDRDDWRRPEKGFGPLVPTPDETTGLPLLKLPRGFRYRSFGWTGDLMSDGTPTPDRHDGMAVVDVVFNRRHGPELVLIRNHERGAVEPGNPLPVIGGGYAPVYDGFSLSGVIAGIGGGTTALRYGLRGFTGSEATLAGTLVNCAGGRTPWGSWLTCEETTIRGSALGAADHGYVFEVPAPHRGKASARPIVDMGFMSHEAAAVDPETGHVYLTEDNGPHSGFYRFVPRWRPRRSGDLERGGRLEMLKVLGTRNADLRAVERGDTFHVEWVPISDPNADPEDFAPPFDGAPPIAGVGRSGPYLQGEALGAARFSRGEGCWYHNGTIYFIDTSGGAAEKGVVWALELPKHGGSSYGGRLTALFVSPNEETADNPDNITLSPHGGIVVCEDGGGQVVNGTRTFGARLLGIDRRGASFPIAENNVLIEQSIESKPFVPPNDYRGFEFAGPAFSPLGNVLFVNIQTPGITFAIEGPWRKGGL